MKKQEIPITVEVYDALEALSKDEERAMEEARKAR